MGGDFGDDCAPGGGATFRALVEHSRDLVSVTDPTGRVLYVSPSHKGMLGWDVEDLIGTNAFGLVHPDDIERAASNFERISPNAESPPVELRFRHRDGHWVWVEYVAINLIDDPTVGGIVVNSRDVTVRRQAEGLASDQAHILELVASGADLDTVMGAVAAMVERWIPESTGVVLLREAARVRVGSAPNLDPASCELLGSLELPPLSAPVLGTRFLTFKIGGGLPGLEQLGDRLREQGYQMGWAALIGERARAIPLGAVLALRRGVGKPSASERRLLELASNATGMAIERNHAERQLRDLALHDPLTGLANRIVLDERLQQVAATPRRGGSTAAVLFLDLDRFKLLNDSVGHSSGDRLLTALAARLREVVRPGDLIARFGGDEFVFVCEGLTGVDEASQIAERLLELVARPFVIDGREVVLTASIGVTLVNKSSPEATIREADTAMYHAKLHGRARVELFDETLRARAIQRLDLERDLRHALERDELQLHYQPAFFIATNQLVGFEALVRWQHPTLGWLVPDRFLDVAEDSGLITPIGAWVMETALRQARQWKATHPDWPSFAMGVNIAARQVLDPTFAEQAARIIETIGIDPTDVVFEITETAVLTESPAIEQNLNRFRRLGIHIALDDFGTGYSSLVHLKRFPIQTVKLDQSFIRGLTRDTEDDAIVASLINLADQLGVFVVAEGIENVQQAEQLTRFGCQIGQGHYWTPAMAPSEIEIRLASMVGSGCGRGRETTDD